MIEISFPTFRHALEDVQKAHEQVFNLVPVQFVAAQHVAAGDGHTLVLERQKTNERKKRVEVSDVDGTFVQRHHLNQPNFREEAC